MLNKYSDIMQFILGIVVEKPAVGFWLNSACMIRDRAGSGCAPTAGCYGRDNDL